MVNFKKVIRLLEKLEKSYPADLNYEGIKGESRLSVHEFIAIRDYLDEFGYIKINYVDKSVPSKIRITPKGINFLRGEKKKIIEEKLSKSNYFLMVILVIATICNVYFINENNKTIQDLYLIPNYASLDPVWMENQGSFSQQELSTIGGHYIRLCFYNEGRAPTGHIHVHLDHNDPYFGFGYMHIINIEGGQTNCSKDFLTNNNATRDEEDRLIFNEEHIPVGNHTLEFYVECNFCTKEPLKIVKIPICIWGKDFNSTNCEWTKKEKW